MPSITVGNFGIKNGVQTYRVCGEREDLKRIVVECIDMGHEFFDSPEITHVHKGQYTVLLKLKIPVKVGEKIDEAT